MTLQTTPRPEGAAADLHPDPAMSATLDALRQRLEAGRPTNIGFPSTFDFDYTVLYSFFGLLMNNVGDPYTPSAFPANCKDLEREVVEWAADLLRPRTRPLGLRHHRRVRGQPLRTPPGPQPVP